VVSNQYIMMRFENAIDYFEQTSLQKDRNLDPDELSQFVSNKQIIIEFEVEANYFEQISLQRKDQSIDFDEYLYVQHIPNQHITVKFEKMFDKLEPILLQREEKEDLSIDFN
ncbi:31711_t:CDS:2, partial [Racocetra persica]